MTITRTARRIQAQSPMAEQPVRHFPSSAPDMPNWPQLTEAEQALLALPNAERFNQFQQVVKNLLEQGLKRLHVHSETYRSPQGRFQRMLYLSELDRELTKTRNLLLEQNPGIFLLKQFDAIRGLLLDVWT